MPRRRIMKLAEMLTYFQMMGQLEDHGTTRSHEVYDKPYQHSMHHVRINEKDHNNKHAEVIYRKYGATVALVYADIFFTGFLKADVVWIQNAKLVDLKNQFIGYDA